MKPKLTSMPMLEWVKRPVDSLGLSIRAQNALAGVGVRTIRQLAEMQERDLLDIKNLGITSTREIQEKLKENGLVLGCNFNDAEADDYRRFTAACAALQGLLSNPNVCTNQGDHEFREWVGSCDVVGRIAKDAIAHADALLAALTPQPEVQE